MAEHPYPPNLTEIGGNRIDLCSLAALSLAGNLLYPAQPVTSGISQIRQIAQRPSIGFKVFKMMLYIGILTGVNLFLLIIDNINIIGEELVHGFIEVLKLSYLRLRIADLLRQASMGLRVVMPGALERGL